MQEGTEESDEDKHTTVQVVYHTVPERCKKLLYVYVSADLRWVI